MATTGTAWVSTSNGTSGDAIFAELWLTCTSADGGKSRIGVTYWMDLADAYEAVGEPSRAREAFAKAQSAHPISSDVAWRYGNYLLRQRDYPQAFAQMRRALETDPSLTAQAISECSKVSSDLPTVLKRGLA